MLPQKLRVLVTDDWPDSADSLAHLLRMRGHAVHVALGGAQAIEKAAQTQPDVVILDIKMPNLTGLEVARILSQVDGKRPLLIAISGCVTKEDRKKAYDAGFVHFFAKPTDLPALFYVLDVAKTFCS
jgi:two-component system, OmpR family, response regulator